MKSVKLKMGYAAGQTARFNERIIDGNLLAYIGEYIELVPIPGISLLRLLDGTVNSWIKKYPAGLPGLIDNLKQLQEKYDINILYLNIPLLMPFLLLARNAGRINLSFFCITHSVASFTWMRLWLASAPHISAKDLLITATHSCKKALLNLSPQFSMARIIPLFIRLPEKEPDHIKTAEPQHLLSLGRLDEEKNIHLLIEIFAQFNSKYPNSRLTIAGDYTGTGKDVTGRYREKISTLVARYQLADRICFPGIIEGEVKDAALDKADLLINLSTDPGETFGYNLIEAKIHGLPVVCTAWNGFREIVNCGRPDGTLVDCTWEGDAPEIRQQDVIDACSELLDDDMRADYSFNALQNSIEYDYRRIIPAIVEDLAQRVLAGSPGRGFSHELPATPLEQLPAMYDLTRMKNIPLLAETPLSLLLAENRCTAAQWMCAVKPVINHFIGALS